MTKYYLAYDDGNIIIRNQPNSMLEKYNQSTGTWVADVELARIYFGDMPVKVITESEAYEKIYENQ